MEERDLDPVMIQGVNYADPEKVERLAESQRSKGWTGRRVLVEELDDRAVYPYAAWTGTHRLEASRTLGVSRVPCVVITVSEANQAFRRAGYDKHGFQSWRDAVTAREGRADTHRLRGLLKAGLAEAVRMLQEEMESEGG